jgi:TusA-related sulfurtransferase
MVEIPSFHKEINLKGTMCPYNFVKSKLALEEVSLGQTLRIVVDFPSAVEDVPRGMKYEGQEVLHVRQLNASDWEIMVRRKR